MWYVWPANAQTCLRIRAVWSETLLALIFYECLSYWPNIIWSRKLKRWLHRLVAFTPHWWRQSYDTATARGRVNISCCKKENEKKKKKQKKKHAANEITSNPVWHNWGNKTALHFLQTAKGRSGSVVECLTWDRGVAGPSLHCVLDLCSVHDQHRLARPDIA